jgi:uncharacterized protein YjiK
MKLSYLSLVSLAVAIGCSPSEQGTINAASATQQNELNTLHILSTSSVEIIELSEAGKAVKIQPKGAVKSYNGCMEIQRFQYMSEKDQAAVLTTVRNEAANLSANTISVLDYNRIGGSNTWLIGMYQCNPT